MHYGVDVAATRFDDLDRMALEYANTIPRAQILEIGCGKGTLAAAMIARGAQVIAVDIENTLRVPETSQLQFIQADARQLPVDIMHKHYDAIVMQRTFHYLPYEDATQLLTRLSRHSGTTLYISVSGTETAIAKYYPALAAGLPERFARLDNVGQKTFSITAPLCLYSQCEFKQLLTDSGWVIDSLWTSAFGNHKAIAGICAN